jgi:hypothetical protein
MQEFIYHKHGMTDNPIIREAVLSPIYLEDVENYLFKIKKDIRKQKINKLKILNAYLTIKFYKYSVIFIEDNENMNNIDNIPEYKAGITKSSCLSNRKGTIKIYTNNNLLKIQTEDSLYDYFIKNVLRILGHELIHRHQGFVITNQKLKNYIMDHSKLEVENYLSNKQEMMARAWQILEEFRYVGLKNEDIRHLLSNIEKGMRYSKTLYDYFVVFKDDENKDVFKRLQKYIYQYFDGQEVK